MWGVSFFKWYERVQLFIFQMPVFLSYSFNLIPFFLFYCCFIISFILIVCFVHTLKSACSFWAMNVVHRLWISIHSQINDVTKRSTNEKHWQRARTLMRTKHVYDLSSIYLFFTSHSFIFHNFFFSHTFLISRTETKQNKVIVKNKKK